MAFRRKMYHAVDIVFFKNLCNRIFVRNIGTDKGVIRQILHIL